MLQEQADHAPTTSRAIAREKPGESEPAPAAQPATDFFGGGWKIGL
jgi:hypothetical protein